MADSDNSIADEGSRAGEERITRYRTELSVLAGKSRTYSTVRVLSFFGAIIGFFAGLAGDGGSNPALALWIGVPCAVAFVVAFWLHENLLRARREIERSLLLAEEASERRRTRRMTKELPPSHEGDLLPLETGQRIFAPDPACYELDEGATDDLGILAGPRNLFGFLDVSSTVFGARRLVYMLTHPLSGTKDIEARQAAVRAVAEAGEARAILLRALIALREHSFVGLPRLMVLPATFANRMWIVAFANLWGSIAPLALLGMCLSYAVAFPETLERAFTPLLFFAGIANLAIIGSFVRESNPARNRLLALGPLVSGLSELDRRLTDRPIDDPAWRDMAETLAEARPALHKLKRWIAFLSLHEYGIIFEIINIVCLWELRFLPAAERVFERHRDALTKATGVLAEIEALLALSGPLDEQDDFELPTPLEDERPQVVADEIGHPLLESDVSIRNPLSLGANHHVAIVTGSNMAGKSTYLKSIGCNVVLAGAGGPVCAKNFRWTPVRVFTDINVRDSLDDGKSYFQVEVERVLSVIREAERDRRVLGIFDELFRGTNSVERLFIARSLLRHLRDLDLLLVVATHDNALTRLVTDDEERGMANYHFRESVEGKVMSFDYRLWEGPATTRNAIRVLEAAGYPENIVTESLDELGAADESRA